VNSKAHQVIEYLDDMKYVRKAKIEDMTQILLTMIERVKTKHNNQSNPRTPQESANHPQTS
jgi:hypothetical protein